MIFKIPNILTIGRLILVPFLVFAFFLPGSLGNWLSFSIFVLASFTDFLDGFFARLLKQQSKLGELLDPIADKLFFFTCVLIMYLNSDIPLYFFILIGMRDLVVFLGSLVVALEKNWKAFMNVRPRILGKVTTTFQFLVLIIYVLVVQE